MQTKTITMRLPIDIFSILKKTPEEFSKAMRIAAAVKWYEMGTVSQEKAAEIAGLCREDFLNILSEFTVSPFQYSAHEILHEADYE